MRYWTASTEVTLPTPTSASKRRTLARVCSCSATAVLTETVVFPTPPFGAKMLITRPSPMIVPSSAVAVVERRLLAGHCQAGSDEQRLQSVDQRVAGDRLDGVLIVGCEVAVGRELGDLVAEEQQGRDRVVAMERGVERWVDSAGRSQSITARSTRPPSVKVASAAALSVSASKPARARSAARPLPLSAMARRTVGRSIGPLRCG